MTRLHPIPPERSDMVERGCAVRLPPHDGGVEWVNSGRLTLRTISHDCIIQPSRYIRTSILLHQAKNS